MIGNGVMHVAGDAGGGQVRLQGGAVRRAQHVQVSDEVFTRGRWQPQRQIGQGRVVARGDGAALRVGGVQQRQLGAQHRGL